MYAHPSLPHDRPWQEHPEQAMYNNMRMYQHTYATKVDGRYVLLGVREPSPAAPCSSGRVIVRTLVD
jgi:hypothetical protein